MQPEPAFPGKLASPVLAALRKILRPLVRLLLTHGVTYPLITDVVKSTYVDVARREFRLTGKRQTDSRISLLTGVHRKDVKRLIEEGDRGGEGAPAVSLGGALVARWLGEADLTDERGNPLPLPRLASDGGKQSFEALVESVSKDIRSRVILDEWLRLGVVRLDRQDRVLLNPEALAPSRDFGEKLQFLEANVHDHLAAAVHNLSGGVPPMLEREDMILDRREGKAFRRNVLATLITGLLILIAGEGLIYIRPQPQVTSTTQSSGGDSTRTTVGK